MFAPQGRRFIRGRAANASASALRLNNFCAEVCVCPSMSFLPLEWIYGYWRGSAKPGGRPMHLRQRSQCICVSAEIEQFLCGGVCMSINVVLAVGMDLWVLERKRKAWREAGYFVTPAGSVREAIDDFRSGDFDLVVMSASIPAESRERFTSMIRAAGSSVPVICATNPAGDWDLFANATIPKEHRGTGGRYRESGG